MNLSDKDIEFLKVYNDIEKFPTSAHVADHLGMTNARVRTKASELRRAAAVSNGAFSVVTRQKTEAKQMPGIYKIENTANGKVYVGQAINLQKRWIKHLHHLRVGDHHCKPLQNSWNKYGEPCFKFSILEQHDVVSADLLTEREQHYVDVLSARVQDGGFNVAPVAGSNIGVKYSPESKAKMSAAQKGRTFTDEARAKISEALTGRVMSEETIRKRVEKTRGQKRSKESIDRLRAAHRAINETPLYEAFGKRQTLRDWADEYGINPKTLRNRVVRAGMCIEDAVLSDNIKGKRRDLNAKSEEPIKIPQYGVVGEEPLSETLIPKLKTGTKEECIEDLRQLAIANPEISISRNYYRIYGKYAESVWSAWAGTFEEFKRQSSLKLTRQQHGLERHIAKHASVDHYRRMNEERANYGGLYLRPTGSRFKTVIITSDLHDEEMDPFFRRVLTDTIERVQPDAFCIGGDGLDLPEFGKYSVDPRDWGPMRRINYMHSFLSDLREVSPDMQIDWLEGNHEYRLLRHLGDSTPALKVILEELHGMTIRKLLGLDRFQVNYIAKADLSAYRERDITKEIGRNYHIYYDCLLVHHFPEGRNMGLPGVNGHHHKHISWPHFSPVYGAYEWHQLGCGHMRDASYCSGEKWHMGFMIANIDTWTRQVNFDYVPVTDFAVSGGQWYRREKSEQTTPESRIALPLFGKEKDSGKFA